MLAEDYTDVCNKSGRIPQFDDSLLESASSFRPRAQNGGANVPQITEDEMRDLQEPYVPQSPPKGMVHGSLNFRQLLKATTEMNRHN